MKPLDMTTPLDYIFPTFTLRFHESSYVGLSFLIQMCFTWQIFPSLGTLEELVLEDHFHLLHTLLAYPSYPLACCSIMSSTLLDIGTARCDLAWEFGPWFCLRALYIIFIYLLILKKSKKMIYCENSKNWKMSWKKWSS